MIIPDSTQKPIIEKAMQFVTLLDQQQPLKAWAATTRYFQRQLPPKPWQLIYRDQRQRFGGTIDRQLAGYRFTSSFEKALDGLYLQVRFKTDFETRAEVSEQVTMYKDFDGRWRVIGYLLELN
ncbi:DUF4019 domain-containing protein [Malonomonas rubra]|uniref:DUF4019 domain-containing protein n=1 Tax=Malonomonas rubra TaxID=57040 RepID=UPI0026EBFF68|nr:DUF4019 domain-containing protein [Malonomonas rubra]